MSNIFDMIAENKEKYYKKADILIRQAGYSDFLKVDRNSIGVRGSGAVKVFLTPVLNRGNLRKWQRAKKAIKGLKESRKPKRGEEKSIYLYGWIEMES